MAGSQVLGHGAQGGQDWGQEERAESLLGTSGVKDGMTQALESQAWAPEETDLRGPDEALGQRGSQIWAKKGPLEESSLHLGSLTLCSLPFALPSQFLPLGFLGNLTAERRKG